MTRRNRAMKFSGGNHLVEYGRKRRGSVAPPLPAPAVDSRGPTMDTLDEKVITGSSPAEGAAGLTLGPAPVSPLGWSIAGRLLCAAVAAALLWLAVVWALGWF